MGAVMPNLTGKQRFWVVVAVAWIVFCFFAIEPWQDRFPSGDWKAFLTFGTGPVAFVLAIIWVRRGFQNDKKRI